MLTVAILVLMSLQLQAQTINTWVGNVSTNYFNKLNWSDTNIVFSTLTSTTILIGAGAPNDCLLVGGNNSNVNYRPARLNTLTGAMFTLNGAVFPNNNDSLNGTIILNSSAAELNIRNIGYIGYNSTANITVNSGYISTKNGMFMGTGSGGSATVTLNGGAIYAGGGGVNMDLTMGNNSGSTAQLNILGGSVTINRNLIISTNSFIHITGLGILKIGGDKRSQLAGLISDGRLNCTTGKSLAVTYDGTNTLAQIPQNPLGMITEFSDSVVLKTTNLICVIDKNTGNVISYRYKGVETVANKSGDAHKYMYHDFTTSNGFETVWGCTYEVVQDDANFAHIVLKRPYTPSIGHVTPVDCEIHYALKKDDKGVYVYSRLEHKPNYKKFDIGSWRQVWWLASNNGINVTERIYTDSLRSWQMNSPSDPYVTTGVAEIIKQTGGVRANKFDGKYEYSLKFWDNPVWGHASNVNNIGIWCLNTSLEYFNEGPMHHDLNAAAGIIHQCLNGVHYGDGGIFSDTLTSWTKVFGPYMLLVTDKATGDENWAAAKARQVQEQALWPYDWVKDSVAYPPASLRGSITGSFVVTDALKPSFTGGNAWIGVTDLTDGASNFQFESKNYQYWIKSNSDGQFTIPNVRPGTYSLFAFVDGAVGEYRLNNVIVTAGAANNLGTLTRAIDRTNGSLIWEIGTPDRTSAEFKLGKFDYCEGFMQEKFRDSFPNPIEYNVADKNWSSKLSYAQTKYPTTTFTPGDMWKWRLNFTLPAGTILSGNARLTIAYASNDHAQQWIYVNNEAATPTAYYPDNSDGNAFIRQANFAKYTYKQVLIPMSKLMVGNNVITLAMPSNSGWVSHLMYDYISLEATVPNLPVTFISFDAKLGKDKKVDLSWKTTNEINSKYFDVEHSIDGRNFTSVGNVKSNNSSNLNVYTFVHSTPVNGINFYRLKQVDVDGKFIYTTIRQVEVNFKNTVSMYPNPARTTLTINSESINNLQHIVIYDALGKLLETRSNIGSKQIVLKISHLIKGVYLIKINNGTSITMQKLIKE